MVGGTKGLAIGKLVGGIPPPSLPNLLSVANPLITSQDACEQFLSNLWPSALHRKRDGPTVRLARAVHTSLFGPTGAGKGTSFIIPWLLDVDENAVVLDFKGENAAITARHRERVLGHRIVLLDPFHVVTSNPDSFNPIQFISKDSPNAIDECRDLAEQLVIRTGEERDRHWNDSAEMWISATIAAVVFHSEADYRSLQTVRDVLSNPHAFQGFFNYSQNRAA